MRTGRYLSNILILLVIFAFPADYALARSELEPPRYILTIESGEHKHAFGIEIADTPQKWEHGLMFRRELSADRGMLFVFKRSEIAQFWMKNTLIPLDMLFIDSSGKIIKIKQNAEPESVAIISSGSPVKYVLEIAGGTSERLKLQTGDRVSYAAAPKHK